MSGFRVVFKENIYRITFINLELIFTVEIVFFLKIILNVKIHFISDYQNVRKLPTSPSVFGRKTTVFENFP